MKLPLRRGSTLRKFSSGTLVVSPSYRVRGRVKVPGDKSISHRAAILSSLAHGSTEIEGYLESRDCLNTLICLSKLGVAVERKEKGNIRITGNGLILREPEEILNVENSGTTMRLLSGVLSGQPFYSVLTGDMSIRRRPMDRVVIPLQQMGANLMGRRGGTLAPLSIKGGPLTPINYNSKVASAQVKSSILLAGLYADGVTSVTEPYKSRDHTERMMKFFGADVKDEGLTVCIKPGEPLKGSRIKIPGDISSAAFFMVAAILLSDSEVTIEGVGLNPTRCGVIDILRRMGAHIEILDTWEEAGEPIGDLLARSSSLKGISIEADEIPRAIDEIPILCVAAALAEGETVISGADELRKKESDRISTIVSLLRNLGSKVHETEDGMIIEGGLERFKGGAVKSFKDHRLAMSAAIAGLVSQEPVMIEDADCIDISFPGFDHTLLSLIDK